MNLWPLLPAGQPGDPGLFGPDSVVWRVARERALLLGGPAAVLLQLADPRVAAGVAEHSDYRDDPWRRLVATLHVSLTITFGDRQQAAEAAGVVRRRHEQVTGLLPRRQGRWPAGVAYRATDPELALWVFATLIAIGLDSYQLFVGPLTEPEQAAYYKQSGPFAAAFGVPRPVLPDDYPAFRRYWQDMLRQITVDELAREQANAVLRCRLRGIPVTPAAPILAGLLLPAPVRRAYRLPTVPRAAVWPLRQTIRHLPAMFRYWPHYATASRRVADRDRAHIAGNGQ